MPTDATALKRAAGSTRQISPMRLMEPPRLPERLRRIDPDGSAMFEEKLRRQFEVIGDQLEQLRQQIRQ